MTGAAGSLLLGLLRDPAESPEPPTGPPVALTPEAARELVALARAHQVSGYLYHELDRRGLAGRLPPEAREALAGDFRAGFGRHLLLRHRLSQLARASAAAGIELFVFKGLALAEQVYDHPGARYASDVDILLPAGRGPDVRAAAAAQGLDLSLFEMEEHHHDLTADGVFPVRVEELWGRARFLELEDARVRVPSPEDALLVQALTCCRRGFWELRALVDAREILRRHGGEIDAESMARRSREWGLAWSLGTLLRLSQSLLGGPRPELAGWLPPPGGLRGALWRRLLDGHVIEGRVGTWGLRRGMPAAHYLLRHAVVPGRLMGRQLAFHLWPPSRELRRHYPGWPARLLPLARLWHPLAVGALAAAALWSSLARGGRGARRVHRLDNSCQIG